MKKLTELNPSWIGLTRTSEHGEGISFDCPCCGSSHKLCAYFSNPVDGQPAVSWQNPVWNREGDNFDNLTLSPSIQYPCFHGWIEEGQVIDISESPKTINILINGLVSSVALSPKQFKELCL